jgi:hypothetical protein
VAGGEGCGVDVLMGYDLVPTANRDVGHGRSGSSATGPG